jgi:hypothetical protein
MSINLGIRFFFQMENPAHGGAMCSAQSAELYSSPMAHITVDEYRAIPGAYARLSGGSQENGRAVGIA